MVSKILWTPMTILSILNFFFIKLLFHIILATTVENHRSDIGTLESDLKITDPRPGVLKAIKSHCK